MVSSTVDYIKNIRRRRRPRRRNKKMVMYKNVDNKVHMFRQVCQRTSIVSQIGAATEGNFSFKLADCQNSATFFELFDSYRIRKVVVKIIPRHNTNTGVIYNGSGIINNSNSGVIYYTSIDYNDLGTIATLASFLERGNVRTHKSTDIATITIYPKPSATVYATSGTAYHQLKNTDWMQLSNTGVAYFGLRTFLPDVSAVAGAVTLDVMATYYIEFKNVT